MAGLVIQVFVLMLYAVTVHGQGTVENPVITDYSVVNKRVLRETLPKGYFLGQVKANDPMNERLEFFITGPAYAVIAIDKDTGNVTVTGDLDYENRQTRSLTLTLTVSAGRRRTRVDGSIIIKDENDNAPVFTNEAPSAALQESAQPGKSVVAIQVTDRDNSNPFLELECIGVTALQKDACETFGLVLTQASNREWNGYLELLKTLDYETRKSYALILRAYDGVTFVTNQVTIGINDTNDSPPIWERTGPKIINEEEPIGTPVQTVTATDPDISEPRRINYELMTFTDVFNINASTGVITNAVRLDYDATNSRRNVPYDLKIKAREVIPNPGGRPTLGDDPRTTATVDIKITVRDINDNKPVFYQGNRVVTRYQARIDENIATGQNVPTLQISVADNDQSDNFNTFRLRLSDFNDIFGIIPTLDSSSTSPSIIIEDANRIDYETGPREYIFEIIATESRTNPAFTSTATVTLSVNNVNDETPKFDQQVYVVNVSELAVGGQELLRLEAKDPEEGIFGQAGMRYKLLGNSPEHFVLNERTGVLTVKDCPTPGTGNCIDYERKKRYTMRATATDFEGDAFQGETGSTQVIVNILDENDNRPVLEPEYVRYIRELETVTINPLVIEAKDPDIAGGPVIYSLDGYDARYWQINLVNVNGVQKANITAIRPVRTEDAAKPGKAEDEFEFTLVAQDQQFPTTAKIIVKVLDSNNYAPRFLSGVYRKTLPEGSPGEISLLRVSAQDLDSATTGNGIIDFVIVSGSLGKFQLKNPGNESNGVSFYVDVYTTQDATFDFLGQNPYNLTLECRDRGSPLSLTGSASVIVSITDTNNVDPIITPTSTTINVQENALVGTSVHRISANDPDANSILRYFMTPMSASQPNGAPAIVDFRNLFEVNVLTGVVSVKGPLNRDDVAFITNDLRVEDQGSNPFQVGTGALFIRITEYNDQDPVFNSTFYNVTLDEERVRNAYVVNLECTDEDDRIASYSIRQTSPRDPQYFSLLPNTGTVLVNNRVDFERIERITLEARCVDTGQDPRTATSTVVINVVNLNDNSPIFVKDPYSHHVDEKVYVQETTLLKVSATDIDKGDYGVVRYRIRDEDNNKFRIDSVSGQIYIRAGASFDRENTTKDDLVVFAYDSPNNPDVRRQTSVPVYITIDDANDNCPVFDLDIYTGVIPETADVGTNIVDIFATDKDIGINAELEFGIQAGSGTPPEAERLFRIDSRDGYGRLLTSQLLNEKVGLKSFNVTVTDLKGLNSPDACITVVPVQVDVKESQNDAPEWIRPPQRDFVIYVLESQYRGMLVYSAKAVDENEGPNGVVDYYFSQQNNFVSTTPEFRINKVTGVIRAEVVFDREQRDRYFLTLMARDRGNPASSSETTLTVVILDVDDNDPKFPMKNGVVLPLLLPEAGRGPVLDNEAVTYPPGKLLGNCSYLATDADSDDPNNQIFYRLLTTGNQIEEYISVDRTNCRIYLKKAVDYELFKRLEFDILAFNDKNDDSVKRYKREVNPSILPVVVEISNRNDNPPVFSQQTYLACVSVDAPYRETILEVSATDPDAGDSSSITYSLEGNTNLINSTFGIDPLFGTIFNRISFRYGPNVQRQYSFNVAALDGTANSTSAKAVVFVTDSSNLVKVKVNRPRSDVEPFKQQLVSTIQDNSNGRISFACIDSIANHRTADGEETVAATDAFLLGARKNGEQYSIIPAGEMADIISQMQSGEDDSLSAVYVTKVEEKGESGDFELTEDAILAILIICILLIFLAIVLLILACYCIRNSRKRKVRRLQADRHTIVQTVHEPVETSFNPVYSMGPDNTEYATVKKTAPINPVVIPAPQNLQPFEAEEPYYPNKPGQPQPMEPEEPEPVIETEVLSDPVPDSARPQPLEHPEYEDRIETTIVDDEPPPPPPVSEPEPDFSEPISSGQPTPVPAHDGDIEVEIKDSPPASPASSRKADD